VNLGVKPLASRRRPDPTVAAACDRLPQRQQGERTEPGARRHPRSEHFPWPTR